MIASRVGVLVVALALVAGVARASDEIVVDGLRVAVPRCPLAPLSVAAFVDSLRVELAGRVRGVGATRVTLSVEPCDTTTKRVHVQVTDDTGRGGVERDVGLEDVARDARPRALALAVAELVRGTQGAPPPAPPPVVASPPPATAGWSKGLAADATFESFPERGATLWGGRLSASLDAPRGGLALFGEALAGSRGYALGDVTLQSFGAGLAAGPRWVRGRWGLAPAFVGALGWAGIQGHAGAPDVAAGAGSGLTAALRARVAASSVVVRVVSVRAFVEAGWMLRGLDATVGGGRGVGLSGATVVLGLGLGL